MPKNLPAALVIMDGFGCGDPGQGNAIDIASTPVLDGLFERFPTTCLHASGLSVGLPDGQMGNSEVGHLNIGAGRVVFQELTRITQAIQDGSLRENDVLATAIDAAVQGDKALHFMGLVSDGGVHSHQEHLYALLEMARDRGARQVYVHAFLDGRDVPPRSGSGYVRQLIERMRSIGLGEIATVMGRYYAMDRDQRWERVEKAWRAMVLGDGVRASDAIEAIEQSYTQGVSDEFVVPVVLESAGEPVARMTEGDSVVFFNFRPDRAREMTRAMTDPVFQGFSRAETPRLHFACLTEYDPTIDAPVAFPKHFPCCTLADVISEAGLRQLHIAETEKYAHVTFFLNGGQEQPKAGEERVLVPSPRVATYDLQPEMSAPEVTDELVSAIENDRADFYIVNYANCDMVGHTGVLEAAVLAVEAVDSAVGRVIEAIRAEGGVAMITADHGNAERMIALDGITPFTAHTNDDVPLCVVADGHFRLAPEGILADIAPTLAKLVGLDAPAEWTGRSLLLY